MVGNQGRDLAESIDRFVEPLLRGQQFTETEQQLRIVGRQFQRPAERGLGLFPPPQRVEGHGLVRMRLGQSGSSNVARP